MVRISVTRYTWIILYCLLAFPATAQVPVGQWQEHLPSLPAVSVTLHNSKVYCATAQGLYSVTTGAEQDITRYSKVNGLHDIGISAIGANGKCILVAYNNGNLDLLQGNNIINIPELLRKQIDAGKTTYRIVFNNDDAYLCTEFGIVVINTSIPEITNTYLPSGNYNAVFAVAIQQDTLYAATASGIYKAPLKGRNLADYRNWLPASEGLPGTLSQQIISFNGRLICLYDNQLFRLTNNTWVPWYSDNQDILNLTVHQQQLILSEKNNANTGRIVVLNSEAAIINTIQYPLIKRPRETITYEQEIWIADSLSGLLRYDGSACIPVRPDAPASIISGDLLFHKNSLWAAAGGVTASWTAQGNTNGYYSFRDREWKQFSDTIKDVMSLATDPSGNGIYAGSFGGGLLHIREDGAYTTETKGYNISGLATDASANLWVAAYGATYNLMAKQPDNTWLTFRSPYAQTGNAISQLVTDDYGQVYMVSPKSNGLYVFYHNNTLRNTSDDQWRQLRMGSGQGNLPSNDVYCVAKDHNGSIWIGTGRGIAVLSCDGNTASVNCDAVLPIIQQGNFAGYLFQDEQVNTIATDGANRKWVGTLNGAWLVNETGDAILEHFNTGNSPLPDNNIYRIAIDPLTGEVYFATAKGLMSWRGTATEPVTMRKDSVLVFPNPVPHGYSGTIAIRGLVQNALVKITDISGKMVYQTRAQGGQAVWNGVDYTGHRPQSGVYLVFAAGETGGEHLVTKIVFIN